MIAISNALIFSSVAFHISEKIFLSMVIKFYCLFYYFAFPEVIYKVVLLAYVSRTCHLLLRVHVYRHYGSICCPRNYITINILIMIDHCLKPSERN